MRIVLVAVGVWLSMTLAAGAEPPTAAEVFRQFGLFGTWAVDCGRPASPSNPYVNDIVQDDDVVVEEHHLGPRFAVNRYRVLSAERLSATQVALDVVFRPGEAGQQQKLIMLVSGGQRRTLFNQPKDGEVRVRDGIVLAASARTPILGKCH